VGLSRTAIFTGYFFGYFRDEASVLHSDTQSVIGFSVIPKYSTLNDREWLFRVKFCFLAGFVLLAQTVRHSKNNCVKTNKDRHILSSAQIFGRDSSFWEYIRFVRIVARVL